MSNLTLERLEQTKKALPRAISPAAIIVHPGVRAQLVAAARKSQGSEAAVFLGLAIHTHVKVPWPLAISCATSAIAARVLRALDDGDIVSAMQVLDEEEAKFHSDRRETEETSE